MPALITHHLFGVQALQTLPEEYFPGQEEVLAFLMGNQGPDPLFFRFRTLPTKSVASHRLSRTLHHSKPITTIDAISRFVRSSAVSDASVARAWGLGFLGHYALDQKAHPLILSLTASIQNSGTAAGLDEATSEIHLLLESELDSWLVWRERKVTTTEYPPYKVLTMGPKGTQNAGEALSYAVSSAYSKNYDASEYGNAVSDMRFIYQHLEPAGSENSQLVSTLELLGRSHSVIQAITHEPTTSDECFAANLEHNEWKHPFIDEISNKSFLDLVNEALTETFPTLVEAFLAGRVNDITSATDYSGKPLGLTEL